MIACNNLQCPSGLPERLALLPDVAVKLLARAPAGLLPAELFGLLPGLLSGEGGDTGDEVALGLWN